MSSRPSIIQADVALAEMTTLEVGGHAEFFADIYDEGALVAATRWARSTGRELTILGGGSNVVVADEGVRGLTLRMCLPGRSHRLNSDGVALSVGAGEDWDQLVRYTVGQGWAGLECLVGIPGRAGAAPIQNIGAYGQELADTALKVRAFDFKNQEFIELSAHDCAFAYRDSRFKRAGRLCEIVTAMTLQLRPGGAPTVKYKELQKNVGDQPSLETVMETVQRLRQGKSMLAHHADGNHRSAGSFFLNPILGEDAAAQVYQRAASLGIPQSDVPSWPTDDGHTKFAAAWLIERSGLTKGHGSGQVGLSTNHTLAIVNRGGASASELLGFALAVQKTVESTFGVTLVPEPRMVGFSEAPL